MQQVWHTTSWLSDSHSLECRAAGCACRFVAPDRIALATPGEVAVDCPRRLPADDPLRRTDRLLRVADAHWTVSARRAAAAFPHGGGSGAVAAGLRAGDLVLLTAAAPPLVARGTIRQEVPDLAAGAGGSPDVATSWIRIKVVHHRTGTPFAGVRLTLEPEGGQGHAYRTRADGAVELLQIEPGRYHVRCDLDGATLQRTLGFVAMGREAAAGDDAAAEDARSGSLSLPRMAEAEWLARVRPYRVRRGDTLERIAGQAGLTWQELAQFNWGTRRAGEVNACLRDTVGCTARSADGYRYEFGDDDVPGVLHIPEAWEVRDLQTDREHVVRVSLAAGVLLSLENQDDLRIPEAAYEVRLADGETRTGRLGRSGLARLDDPAPGPVEVCYPDLDDVEAKSLAACARRAFDARDPGEIFRVLKHSREMIRATIAAYDTWFNDYTGGGLLADIEQEFADPDDRETVDALLRIAHVHPDPAEEEDIFAEAEA